MRRAGLCVFCLFLWCASMAQATIFGKVQGIVHDPQHRPIVGATVVLKATTSDFTLTAQTDGDGQFAFTAITVGDYSVTVTEKGFDSATQEVTVTSGTAPVLHFQLSLTSVQQTTTVLAQIDRANTDSVTPTTLIDRNDIAQTPGADRSNSLQMITDYVPGSYYTHDQLHIRGGHQVSWLIDGVPIPNTNIASNLGPQIDPKDIDYLEVQRGSYDASLGDRTYGEFSVVPRSGFERNNEAELVTTFGNWFQTNDQLNFGGHTQKFAYYAQHQWQPQQSGAADTHWPGVSRRGKRLRWVRHAALQPGRERSVTSGGATAPRLLSDSLRPQSEFAVRQQRAA